jgi:class 3 adenylate cyclase
MALHDDTAAPAKAAHLEDAALVARMVQAEQARGEHVVAWLRMAIFAAIGLLMFIDRVRHGFAPIPLEDVRPLSPLQWAIVAAGSLGWLLFLRSRPYRPIYSLISVVLDVLLLCALCLSVLLGNKDAALSMALGASPVQLSFFFIIASASVRQSPAACLLAGGLAALLLAIPVAWALSTANLDRLPPELHFFTMVPVWIGKLVLASLTTILAARTAQNARRMMGRIAQAIGEQTRALHVFGRYVDPKVARAALGAESKAETRELTVLFTDLRGFTTLSEQHSPAEVLELLNAHYEAILPAVRAEGGTVNKFIGDAIMATFGAPEPQADHAQRAARAALGMLNAMDQLNARLVAEGKPPLGMGVGISTGPAVVGSLGAADRVEYAVIGDTVNMANRLESLNKEFGTQVLLAASTRAALGPQAPVRSLGQVEVKGKTRKVEVFALERHGGP